MSALVGYLLLFLLIGFGFIFVHLVAGKLLRPAKPEAEKLTIYECGEPTVGSAWVQFDLRYYVVALLFVIFDVEVAFFFPWAVVFGQANSLRTMTAENRLVDERVVLAQKELLGQKHLQALSSENQVGNVHGEIMPSEASLAVNRANAIGEKMGWMALVDILVFFGVLLVGFAYLWRRGDLAWVRSTVAEGLTSPARPPAPIPSPPADVLVGSGGH